MKYCLLGLKFSISKFAGIKQTDSKRGTKRRQISSFETLALMADTRRKIYLMKGIVITPFLPQDYGMDFNSGELLQRRTNSDFMLELFIWLAVVIIIIRNGLPQRTLPLCLTIKLKCLCSAHSEIFRPCPPVNCYKKEDINPPLLKAGPSGDVLQDWRSFLLSLPTASPSLFCLLTSVPHCFSLWFYKRTWNPDPQKMVTLRHRSAIFPVSWLSE